MRRSLPALATTLVLALAACGGGADVADDASSTSDQTSTSTTPTTRSPPPSTLPPAGTAPPRLPGQPGQPGSGQPTVPGTLPVGLTPASASALARLIGAAEWDEALPLPQSCVESASFEPAGPRGINGGVVRCTVFSSLADTAAFVRELNRQRRLAASESSGSGSVTFTYGGIARIELLENGDDVTSFTASQLFASPTTTTTMPTTTLPPPTLPPPTLPPPTQPPPTQPPTTQPPTTPSTAG